MTSMNENQAKVIENCYLEKIVMEEVKDFNIMVITKGSIKHISWIDPDYSKKILDPQLNIYEIVKTNPDNFNEIMATKFNVDSYIIEKDTDLSIKKEIIADEMNYVYEILYIDMEKHKNYIKEENINELASLINTNGDTIYSNAIIFKNYIPSLSDSMQLVDMSSEDMERILYDRVHTKVVTFDDDGNWKEIRVVGDLMSFASEFFDDGSIVKKEIPFLMHNLNMWYTTFDYGRMPCSKLINRKIDKAIFFTMKSDEFRGNLSLDEVKKIVKLSDKLESYITPEEYTVEKTDNLGRKIIYNKYKVLDEMYNKYN